MTGYKKVKALLHANNTSKGNVTTKKIPIQNQTVSVKYQAIDLAKICKIYTTKIMKALQKDTDQKGTYSLSLCIERFDVVTSFFLNWKF